MKHNLNDIFQKLGDSASLSSSEKARMRNVISEYVSFKPASRDVARAGAKEHRPFLRFGFFVRPVALVLVAAVFVSGAGVSYAAELANPGDILYPIKVSVNEEVRAAFAATPEKRALWQAARAERRLDEAAALAVSGNLDEKNRRNLEARFEKHADAVVVNTDLLEESDAPVALDIVTAFETRLAAHEALLEELDGQSKPVLNALKARTGRITAIRIRAEGRLARGSSSAQVRLAAPALMRAVNEQGGDDAERARDHEEKEKAGSARSGVATETLPVGATLINNPGEGSVTDSVSPEVVHQLQTAALKAHAEARELFERLVSRLPDNDRGKARELLEKSARAIRDGADALARGEDRDALEKFRTSLELSQRIIVSVKAAIRLDIPIAVPEEKSDSAFLNGVRIQEPTDSLIPGILNTGD